MKYVSLGNTGIRVSRLGIGTGTAHSSGGTVQERMTTKELAALLLHAFDRGINLWDTACQYYVFPHVREALSQVKREEVVLINKLTTATKEETLRLYDESLSEAGTEYFDVCLLHGLRRAGEFRLREGVTEALLELKEAGKVRAIGYSCHGMSALEAGVSIAEMEVLWTRVNHAGLHMDEPSMNLYDRMLSVPWIKNIANGIVPRGIRKALQPDPLAHQLSDDDRTLVETAIRSHHEAGRGVVGMKVMGEGLLSDKPARAIEYVRELPFVDAFIIGMLTKDEVDRNVRLVTDWSISV